LKSPHKPQNNEHNKKSKENTTQSVTPHTVRATTTETETETTKESTEKRDRPRKKHVRNPENIPYYEGDKINQRENRKDWNQQQFDEDGEVVDSSDEDFEQPSDEDTQGNVLTMHQMNIDGMDSTNQTPNKQDTKPTAEEQEQEQEQETPPSPKDKTDD
jgi:hypothetical protein